MNDFARHAKDVLKGMWRRRWAGLLVAWLVGVAGAGVLIGLPDQYQASARIYVDTESVLRPLMSGITVQRNVTEELTILSRILISRPNVEKLIRMTDMDLNVKSPQTHEKLVDSTMRTLEIRSVHRGDNLYLISYQDPNPAQAKRVVQSLLSIFLESSLGNKRRDSEQAQKFIDEQIKSYEQKLVEAENRLKEFRLRYLGIAGGDRDFFGQLAQLNEGLTQARVELRAAEQSRDALKRELAGEEPVFLPAPGASADAVADGPVPEIDTRLATLKQSLDELLRRYTDEHPDVVSARRLIAALETERRQALEARGKLGPVRSGSADRNPVYQQLKVNLAESEAAVAALRARVADHEARYSRLKERQRLVPEAEAELARLNRDYEVQKRNYEGLVARRESAVMSKELQSAEGIGEIKIIDPPRTSPQPVAPNRAALLPLVLAAALGAGLLASFAVSQLLPTFQDSRMLREVAGRPVLGTISLIPSPVLKVRDRRQAVLFAAGFAGLVVCYAIGIFLAAAKMSIIP